MPRRQCRRPPRSLALATRRTSVRVLVVTLLSAIAAVPATAAGPASAVGRRAHRAHSAYVRLTPRQATKVLQRALRLPADGIFGPRTAAAVRSAQARHRLPVTGVVGPATWRALGLPVLRTLREALASSTKPVPPAITPAATAAPIPAAPTSGSYMNPFAGDTVTPERIDMGVDYGAAPGTPIRALGDATVLSADHSNSGWPGGGLVTYRLAAGAFAGHCVYVAEDVVPAVSVGQTVSAGQIIASFKAGQAGIETGWGLADGQTLASSLGEDTKGLASPLHDPGGYSTGAGVHFSLLLAGLGAPAGLITPGAIQGPIAP